MCFVTIIIVLVTNIETKKKNEIGSNEKWFV